MTDDQNLPVELGFALSATFGDGGGGPDPVFSIKAGVVADVTVGLPGITICVSGIEQDITVIEFGPTATGFTFALPTWQTLTPSGSLSLDLPAISGSGEVVSAADGSWSGGLQLAMAAMAIDAYAVIGPKEPLSLAIVLCARFPPPGIQIGFGFAVSGVGGVLAVNRRSDRDALTAAILDGSIDKLLSAGDAQDDSARIIANLPALFPDSPGQVVVGPMLEITWGAGLLTADVMLIIELPNPLQISLIGRLLVDLPFDEDGDDDIAMIHLEARIAAIVTPSVPEVRIVASLNGSRILFFPITGDLFLLKRGGPEATFVFSAGGFHPAFTPPPNVPPLQRVSMTYAGTDRTALGLLRRRHDLQRSSRRRGGPERKCRRLRLARQLQLRRPDRLETRVPLPRRRAHRVVRGSVQQKPLRRCLHRITQRARALASARQRRGRSVVVQHRAADRRHVWLRAAARAACAT